MTDRDNQLPPDSWLDLEEGCSVLAGCADTKAFFRKVAFVKAATEGLHAIDLPSFGGNVKSARILRGLSIAELSRVSGISEEAIRALETGTGCQTNPHPVWALIQVLELSPEISIPTVGHP